MSECLPNVHRLPCCLHAVHCQSTLQQKECIVASLSCADLMIPKSVWQILLRCTSST